MNMLGWSSEAGNPNIHDLKGKTGKRGERDVPGGHHEEGIEIQNEGVAEKIVC